MKAQDVVFLHGLWMPGSEMALLKYRLESAGDYRGHLFSYPSVGGSLDENAERLRAFIAERGLSATHLVGHSLGGVVALRMLARYPDAPGGRVVCLGSPLRGSRAAAFLDRYDWGRAISGRTLRDGVVTEPAARWAERVARVREIGVIAGTAAVGLGNLVTSFDGDHDGTVAVDETRLPGVRDHLCLRVNHTGLVLSSDVATQAAAFLARGEFLRDSDGG